MKDLSDVKNSDIKVAIDECIHSLEIVPES